MQELLIIEPGRTEKNYWSDLWRYRDLLYILASRDISVLYKQTAIGVVWAILRPLLAMVIFTVVFGRIAKMPFDGTPYPEASKMKRPIPVFPRASARGLWLTTIAIALVFGGSAPNCWSGPSGQTSEIPVLSSDPWQANELIKPEELARWLSETSGAKPLVICVAFPVLYPGGHIAGARFAGPTAKPEGIQALKRVANGLSQDKQIVLYCGCCPWDKCPNIRAAFRAMQEWGFKDAKALYLPTNFQQDWIAKGFPIEKGGDKL
jgi:thiosulfate/3-mercaptopyruvate sulfurtransferase